MVTLEPYWISLPTGVLQDWPQGAPLTIHTLAVKMISISDNTATDGLIDLLGRTAVERHAPRNRPFLTTREAFVLKDPGNDDLLQRYRQVELDERWAVLEETRERPLPAPEIFTRGPLALDVEWFFSVEELCDLMAAVGDVPFMSINPGLADTDQWQSVAFKGGSEPGVLNLTTGLVDEAGTFYCVASTWNDDQELDEVRMIGLHSSLLAAIQELD